MTAKYLPPLEFVQAPPDFAGRFRAWLDELFGDRQFTVKVIAYSGCFRCEANRNEPKLTIYGHGKTENAAIRQCMQNFADTLRDEEQRLRGLMVSWGGP